MANRSNSDDGGTGLPYQNPALPVEERVTDLLQRMSLEEKVGQLFHTMAIMGPGGKLADARPALNLKSTEYYIRDKHLTHFNLLGPVHDVQTLVKWHNHMQEMARSTNLRIPITVSTDPRHHFTSNIGTSAAAGTFSQWPETLGFAALRSSDLVERFANIVRKEYVATGFRCALHPQLDLATEPRWARINATFGEDAELVTTLGVSLIRGLQGETLGPHSVSAMAKHFPGAGPQKDGEDAHFTHGREQVYPGNNFDYHLQPFIAALEAGVSQIMPYYGMPTGTQHEEVGFGFSHGIITELLREKLGFQGIVCTDWYLITDTVILGQDLPARAWGCEHLNKLERVQKILDAGCDQFGGESCTELVIQLVREGRVAESRIDASVRRILTEKFVLGLFDEPFVDGDVAAGIVGCAEHRREADLAQRQAFTLLKNAQQLLPLTRNRFRKVYTENIDASAVSSRGFEVVASPSDADLAFIRLRTPFEPRKGGFEAMFHAGSLEFTDAEKDRQAVIYKTVPTIVDIYLERPAIIPEIVTQADAVLASYGSSDEAFLDVVIGTVAPLGKLPFDLPASTHAVEESREDVPYDTRDPLFRFGYGLSYSS